MNQEEILSKLQKPEVLTNDEVFEILQSINSILHNNESVNDARELVIRVLDIRKNIGNEFNEMLNALIEAVGLYPYINIEQTSGALTLRTEAHRSKYLKNIILHEDQRIVADKLQDRSVILSAPTSYGKSLLIKEIIASKKHKNIVVVQPTLALLDETRHALSIYQDYYNLILTTDEVPGDRNIFLFTAERVSEYEHFSSIDFFVIDEFYKLSGNRNDERSTALNIALYKLLKYTNHFYFLGPHVYKITDGFSEAYNAEWIRSHFATVAVDIKTLRGSRGGSLSKAKQKEVLFQLLDSQKTQNLIYCSQRGRVANVANEYLEHCLKEKNLMPLNNLDLDDIREWIDENVHSEWRLKNMLEYGIAFHHGSIPRHLGGTIVDLFNRGIIKHLFCTPTLIEGVNTSAENVILYDQKKGFEPLDYFDFKNIAGRSGRMNQHFIGKVFQFEKLEEEEDILVEIPVFKQERATLELLIQMDEEDLTEQSKELLSEFHALSSEEKVLIKNNIGAPVLGQIRLLKRLKNDPELLEVLKFEKINFISLSSILSICFEYLLFNNDRRGNYTERQIAYYLNRFMILKTMGQMIAEGIRQSDGDNVQRIIEVHLHIFRNWFGYTLPKMFFALHSILKFLNPKVNYNNYLRIMDSLDSQFINKNLVFLREYGVPTSALRKIQHLIPPDVEKTTVLKILSKIDFSGLKLLNYEANKLRLVI